MWVAVVHVSSASYRESLQYMVSRAEYDAETIRMRLNSCPEDDIPVLEKKLHRLEARRRDARKEQALLGFGPDISEWITASPRKKHTA